MPAVVGKTCPYCKTSIQPSTKLKVCPSCKVAHHAACWSEKGSCTTRGCSSKDSDDESEVESSGDTDECPECGEPVRFGARKCLNCHARLRPLAGLPAAEFDKRFLAFLLDGIILFGVTMLLGLLLPSGDRGGTLTSSVLNFVVFMAYEVTLTAKDGATVGKRMMGLRIVSMTGETLSIGQAIVRHLGRIPSGMLLCIGYLMVTFRKDKRALHDLLAKTRVVRVK